MGHQIIKQNMTKDQEARLGPEAAAADTIIIATSLTSTSHM